MIFNKNKPIAIFCGCLFFCFQMNAQLDTFPSNIIFSDIDGIQHDIDQYLADDKHVVIQFFQTYCNPCWNLYQSNQIIDLHNTFGPPGSDEMVVLMLEAHDVNSPDCDGLPVLNGTSTTCSSQGDWLTGNPIPVVDLDSTLTNFFFDTLPNFSGFPYVLSICPTRTFEKMTNIPEVNGEITNHFYSCGIVTCEAEITSEDATIILPEDAMPTLDGDTLPYGTIIQAVFETNGVKQCVGQTTWEGQNTYMTVYGNDATAPEVNGYMDGETYQFCLILPSGCLIENVSATFINDPFFDNTDSYSSDGISGIATLEGSLDFSLAIELLAADTCESGLGSFLATPINGATPYVYNWSNDEVGEMVINLSANELLSVQVIDGNGCPASAEAEMTAAACPPIECDGTCNGNPSTTSGCLPFEVNFQNTSTAASGIDSLIWYFGDGEFESNTSNPSHLYDSVGIFTATLIIFDGFQYDSSTFIIEIFDRPSLNALSISFEDCNATQVNLSAMSSSLNITNWNWNFPEGTLLMENNTTQESSVLVSFPELDSNYDFSLSIEDSNGCETLIDSLVQIPNIPELNIDISTAISPTCQESNGMLSVSVNNGNPPFALEWSHDATITDTLANGLSIGNYEITVIDDLGCTDTIQISLMDDTTLPVVDLGIDTSICANSNLVLNAGNDGVEFNWLLNGLSISQGMINELDINQEGNYVVEVTNLDGCLSKDSILVTINEIPDLSSLADTTICDSDSLLINIACPNCIYSWNTGSMASSIFVDSSGFYGVTVTNSFNCENTESMQLSVVNNPSIDLGENQTICDGENLLIGVFPQPNENYSWNTGDMDAQISIQNEGIYILTIVDNNNCGASDSILVDFQPEIALSIASPQSIICPGDSIILSVTGGENYLWIGGNISLSNDTSANPIAFPMESTIYSVLSENDCYSDTANIQIDLFEIPEVDAGADTCILSGNSLQLSATGGEFYEWETNSAIQSSLSSANPLVEPLDSTLFYVAITDANGCVTADSILVAVIQDPSKFLIPINIITPNNDGKNDVLKFDGLSKFNTSILTVFNRWGNEVYSSVNYQNDWGGTFKGKPLPSGSYYYVLRVNQAEIKSALTILRN
jgi:gliding motility-associated-like protein